MIHIESLEIRYGRKTPVLAIDRLLIERGQRVAIIGPSGAGKSTLLRTIKGYIRPDQGKIEIMGVNLATARWRITRPINRQIGLIYQQFYLLPRLTVLQNVLCGRLGLTNRWRSLLEWYSTDDVRTAWSAICEVGLGSLVHQRTDSLSGGEKQRVAVARVVAQQPSIILADEPVSSLDPAWAEDVLKLIASVQSRHDATLVMSLHQPQWARRFAERVIALREGRLIFDGPPAHLTAHHLEELYRGDDTLHFESSSSAARPDEATAT